SPSERRRAGGSPTKRDARSMRSHLPPPPAEILLLVPDRSPRLGHELGRRLPNPMLLRVLHRVLQYFLFGSPANDVLASRRRINRGTLDDLTHGECSFSSRRLEAGEAAHAETICEVCLTRNGDDEQVSKVS